MLAVHTYLAVVWYLGSLAGLYCWEALVGCVEGEGRCGAWPGACALDTRVLDIDQQKPRLWLASPAPHLPAPPSGRSAGLGQCGVQSWTQWLQHTVLSP